MVDSNLLHPDETRALDDFMNSDNVKELIKTRPEITDIEAKILRYYIENIISHELDNIYQAWTKEPEEEKRTKLWYYHSALLQVQIGLLNKLPIQEDTNE